MSIYVETKIVEGLIAHFDGVTLPPDISVAYPNTDFIQDGSPFIRLSIEKNDPQTWHLGGGREPIRRGLFMAVVCWPVGQGIIDPSEVAGAIRDRFAYNTVINYDGIRILITEEPRVAGDIQEDVYVEIPVIIAWVVMP